ncbi:Tubulin polyglutamylase TTLL11 [Oopsacas minuta]|uniref:Tubulin polyglutamylase TTLL11 n=1 Tax=Oopsacas minuta TaxID=111878 RepID=A0AAV7K0Q9_9METZ|nr:Tubulin polyglutamylase TTLL11 [Oopsacas minuta]
MQPSDLTDPQYIHDIKDDIITSSVPIASTREDCCELSIEDNLLDEEEVLDVRALNKLYHTDEFDQGKELNLHSKKKSIRVDLTYARSAGPIVEMSVRKLNWKCYKAPLISTNRLPCSIHWHGITHEEHIIPKGCYVSKFCGLGELCYKKNLAQTLSRMKELFPDEFSFHPNCWLLPEQYEEFYVHTQEHPKPNKFYIVKPHEGSQGEGIFIFSNPKDKVSLFANPSLVQEYISNPLLLEGTKFDIRLYVLLLSIDPLEVYVSRSGMVRFCTQDYHKPSIKNVHKSFMHLTNYSLNKRSDEYQYTDEPDTGSKRILTHVLEDMERLGYDTDLLWDKIDTVVVSTLQAMSPEIQTGVQAAIRRGELPSVDSCFQILGFDLLIDDKMNVFLLEVNSHPSLGIDFDELVPDKPGVTKCIISQVDIDIKLPVVSCALKLVRKRQKKGPGIPIETPYDSVYKRVSPDLMQEQLTLLEPIANMFRQFLKRDGVTIGSSAFRSFLRNYKLSPGLISTAEADLLFLKATRSYVSYETNTINFQQFYFVFYSLAKSSYKRDSKLENISLLIEHCMGNK